MTGNDARRHFFDGRRQAGIDWALAVDGLPQRVDDAPEHGFADRDFQNAPGAAHAIAFLDVFVAAQHHRADRITFQIERQPEGAAGELQHFALHGRGQAMDAADAVGDADDGAFRAGLGHDLKILNALFDQLANLGGIDLHVASSSMNQCAG